MASASVPRPTVVATIATAVIAAVTATTTTATVSVRDRTREIKARVKPYLKSVCYRRVTIIRTTSKHRISIFLLEYLDLNP